MIFAVTLPGKYSKLLIQPLSAYAFLFNYYSIVTTTTVCIRLFTLFDGNGE